MRLSPHEILRPCRVGVTCTHRLRTMHILRRYWQANTIQNLSSYLYKNTNVWMIVFTWFRRIHYNGETFTITLQVRGNKCRTFHCIKVTNVYVTWLGEAPWKNNTVSEWRTTQKACAPRIGRLHTRNILWFQWGTWKIIIDKGKTAMWPKPESQMQHNRLQAGLIVLLEVFRKINFHFISTNPTLSSFRMHFYPWNPVFV